MINLIQSEAHPQEQSVNFELVKIERHFWPGLDRRTWHGRAVIRTNGGLVFGVPVGPLVLRSFIGFRSHVLNFLGITLRPPMGGWLTSLIRARRAA